MQTRVNTTYLIFKTAAGLLSLNSTFSIAFYLSFGGVFSERSPGFAASYKTLLIIANLLYLLVILFSANAEKKEFKNYALFLISYLSLIVFLQGYEFSRIFHLCFMSALFALTAFIRYGNVVRFLEKSLLSRGSERKVAVIGDEIDWSVIRYINTRPGNFRCVGVLSDGRGGAANFKRLHLGEINRLEELLSSRQIDEVLVSSSLLSIESIEQIKRTTEKYHATMSVLPPYFRFLAEQNCHTEYWMGAPVISVFHSKLSIASYQIAKRALDVSVSLVFLVALFPVLCLLIAPAIWLSNKGPIFFKQLRRGHKRKPFLCYKFRTMKLGGEPQEAVQAKRQDSRVTAVGKSLRKTSIDEVPQFLNVLLGNMSLVGPRPHMVEHDEMYEKFISRYNVRFVAKPGITGWAQINGLRGATEDPALMQRRIEHDLWYIKNWSIWLDIKIITLTAAKMLFYGDKNAY